jgi:hypothetical protein
MQNKLILVVTGFLLFGMSRLQAQETVSASGGEASGSGGTVSYTVGQVVYTTNVGSNGNSVTQGVQQPYEISVETAIPEAEGISLNVLAYPNPTTDYLTVRIENYETADLRFLVFDINGKLLQIVKATGNETKINANRLTSGSYFVKVLDNQKAIKVFKIIKTNKR